MELWTKIQWSEFWVEEAKLHWVLNMHFENGSLKESVKFMKIKFMHSKLSEELEEEGKWNIDSKVEFKQHGNILHVFLFHLWWCSVAFCIKFIFSSTFSYTYSSLFTEQWVQKAKENIAISLYLFLVVLQFKKNRKLKPNIAWIRSLFHLGFIDMQILHFAIYWGTQDTKQSTKYKLD